jgi:hypothetical protein
MSAFSRAVLGRTRRAPLLRDSATNHPMPTCPLAFALTDQHAISRRQRAAVIVLVAVWIILCATILIGAQPLRHRVDPTVFGLVVAPVLVAITAGAAINIAQELHSIGEGGMSELSSASNELMTMCLGSYLFYTATGWEQWFGRLSRRS